MRLSESKGHHRRQSNLIATLLFLGIFFSAGQTAYAVERLHFLIPGGAGGGWDTTARGVGDALTRSGIVSRASYQNMSGGDGSKAIAHLIESAERQTDTLMISSTPIVLKSLKNIFPQSYKDLTPVAAVIADYGAFVVKTDSKYTSWQQMIDDFRLDPRNVLVAGGSVLGGMDHVVAAMAFKQSGVDPKSIRYIPYNAGAKAMVGLLSNETQLLSTGLSEALALAEQGEVRVLAMTAATRMDHAPEVPTLSEQGVDLVFTNWRGFFGAPGLSENKVREFQELLLRMYDTKEWEDIRLKRGWTNLYISGDDFIEFLKDQETEMGYLLDELGIRR
ncbi:MAG: tripartite tricarboxylate transporter substrate binding protein [Proteobacteria bacterium]|nr:tripartite tricarboxylate transporter substrate binding protein [Pseudomonadota bacterium]